VKTASAAAIDRWNLVRAATTASTMCLLLALIPGCSRETAGDVRTPGYVAQRNWVEWVTDPESNSHQPKYLEITLRGDGDFIVGADFPPGTYESQGGRGGQACRWLRLGSGPVGSKQVVKSGGGAGKQRVQIGQSDRLFRSNACQPWAKSP
jgi:hypothetical protein